MTKNLKLLGWGRRDPNISESSNILQAVNVNVIGIEQCEQWHRNWRENDKIQVCVIYLKFLTARLWVLRVCFHVLVFSKKEMLPPHFRKKINLGASQSLRKLETFESLVCFDIIQSTFYRLIKGQQYLKEMYS